MLSASYFNGFLLFFLFFHSQIALSYGIKKTCGEYVVQVKMTPKKDVYEKKVELYFQKKNQKNKLFYETDLVQSFDVACIKNKEKKDLILFMEFYGGNVGPEDVYGLFDPAEEKILIKPMSIYKGNSKKVEKILGFPPPYPSDDENDEIFFCCAQYNTRDNFEEVSDESGEIRMTFYKKRIDLYKTKMPLYKKEINEEIDLAQHLLERGSDPYFVSKITGISIENIKLLQQ